MKIIIRSRVLALALFGMLAPMVLAPTAVLEAQTENKRSYVDIASVKVRADGEERFIDVEATTILPSGCKLEFVLTRQFSPVQTNMITVPANQKIRESFKIENPSPSATPYTYMTQIVALDDQPRAVRKEIEDDPTTYPPSLLPLKRYHYDQSFASGTDAEIQAEVARIQKWFKTEYTALALLDQKVSKAKDAVKEKTDFVDRKGELEEKKWRKMMDDEVLEPIRKAQKVYDEGLAGNRADLIAHRAALADLRNLARAVALRTTSWSIELYQEQGLEPVEADTKPEDISTKVQGFSKRVPKGSDLQKMVERINSKLGIGEKKDGDQG